eukprot:m.91279 g.91279  ORF g.91279 m.91279 type:complete len:126 (+) comp11929_c0_seq2:3533-3910(+)
MGRKKSKRKPPAKKAADKLAETFDCPFCNHEATCKVEINHEKSVGSIKCSVCDEDFQCATNHLTDPIDVYTEWIDACDEANRTGGQPSGGHHDDDDRDYGANDRSYAAGIGDESDDDDGLVDAQM